MPLPKYPNVYDLLKLSQNEISSLNKEELIRYTNVLNKEVNKRIEIIKNSDYSESSPALNSAEKHGDFVIRDKTNRNKTLGDFQAAYNFLKNKTSTITGMKELESDIRKKMMDITGLKAQQLSRKTMRNFWRMYNRLEESNAYTVVSMKDSSNKILNRFMNIYMYNKKRGWVSPERLEEMFQETLRRLAED